METAEPPRESAKPKPPPPELGLALSGGGFRAAFFHVGVLADLAERGLLRHVEVISTVSGGSIVGALYYLHVRALLQAVPDEAVTNEHYLKIVERLAKDLYDGVATNVRGRTFLNLIDNFRMAGSRYSRSDRLGELYDSTFYRPAWRDPLFGEPEEPPGEMIEMRDLLVKPVGEDEGFKPVENNSRRKARVPILVINATSLNTGHNWRFEATGMGEPDRAEVDVPEAVAERDPWEDARREVDRNDRLRWTKYALLAPNQANFELGLAVAASACVPTLFHPLPVTRLFETGDGEDVNVQLVDGGLHDNQGIEGLLEYRCKRIIVSDASGYLADDIDPSTRIPAVGGRSMGIYGDRVREEQLINARIDAEERPFGLMHLRKGITGHVIYPRGADGEPLSPPRPEPPADFPGELFSVAPTVQDYISKVRTDLDSFSQVEAYTLMLDGYLMAGANLDPPVLAGLAIDPVPFDWTFKAVAVAAAEGTHAGFLTHLKRAKSRFFKAIWLSWLGRGLALVVLSILAAVVYALAAADGVQDVFAANVPVWSVAIGALVLAALVFLYLRPGLPQPFRWLADFLYTNLLPAALAVPLWLSSVVVLLFGRIFLRAGRISNVLRP